jgi:hypothetical protein
VNRIAVHIAQFLDTEATKGDEVKSPALRQPDKAFGHVEGILQQVVSVAD